jgi:hypothetical protein
MKPLIQLLLTTLIITTSAFASDYHVFVSEEHGFSMQYPKTWNKGEVIHPQTVIRVESPDGDDYNIVVVQDPALRDMSPQQYADWMLGQVDSLVSNVLSRNYPDARLIKKGTTQLSQQPAVYYMIDYTLSAAGCEIPMRSYAISTKHGDKEYTLTFRTPQAFFDEFIPMIQILALGFQLTKVKVE